VCPQFLSVAVSPLEGPATGKPPALPGEGYFDPLKSSTLHCRIAHQMGPKALSHQELQIYITANADGRRIAPQPRSVPFNISPMTSSNTLNG
jgi:hypothetical protein